MTQTEIEEILNSIKSEYASNTQEFDKILTGINTRLDTIAEEGASGDLIKVGLQELKSELEQRHHFAVEKFENIFNAFQSLNENQDLLTKSSDMKILFDVLTENINHFSQEIADQKTILDDVDKKIVDFAGDNSRKEEIIENIGVLKETLDVFNRGFEASIMDINSNLRNIAKSLMTMDVTDQNDIIKRELENIYMASNGILSSLAILDQKNDDFVKRTESLPTREEFTIFAGRMGETLAELSDKVNLLPLKSEIPDVSFDLERIIDDIQTVKTDLRIANEKEINFEQIETKINSIYDAFQSAVTGLSEDKQQALFSLKDEISQIAVGIEAMKELSAENSVEQINKIEDDIENVSDSLKYLQSEFRQKASDNLAEILGAIEKNRNELSGFNENVSEGLTNYLTSIKEMFTSLGTDLKEQNGAFANNADANAKEKLEQFENLLNEIKNLDVDLAAKEDSYKVFVQGKMKELYDSVSDFKAYLNSAHLNLENKLSEKLSILEGALSQGIRIFDSNLLNFTGKLNECLQTIKKLSSETDIKFGNSVSELIDIKSEIARILDNLTMFGSRQESKLFNFEEKFGGDFEDLKDILDNFGANFETFKYELNQSSLGNRELFTEIVEGQVTNASLKIDTLGVDLSKNLNDNFGMVHDFIEGSKSDSSQSLVELGALSLSIKNLETEFIKNADAFKDGIDGQLGSLSDYITSIKNYLETTNSENDCKVTEKLVVLEGALSETASNYDEKLTVLQNKISDYVRAVEQITNDTGTKLDSSLNEITSIKAELTNLIEKLGSAGFDKNEAFEDVSQKILNKFEEMSFNLNNIKNDVNVEVKDAFNLSLSSIEQNFNNLKGIIEDESSENSDRLNGISAGINEEFNSMKQEIGLINTDIIEALNSKASSVLEEFLPLKDSISSFVDMDFGKLLDDIKSQIEISYLNFSSDMNENLNENHDSFIHLEESYRTLVEKFVKVESVINDLNVNQMSIISMTISDIEKSVGINLEKTNSLLAEWKKDVARLENKIELNGVNSEKIIQNLISNIGSLIENKSDASANDIKDCISVMVNNEDVLYSLETLNSELSERLSIFTEDLASGTKQTNEVLSGLKSFFEDLLERNGKFVDVMDAVNEKVDLIALSDTDEKLDDINAKVDETAGSVQALHDKVDVLALSESDEKLDLMEEMVQALHDKVDVVVLSDSDEKIEEMMQALHEKVDVLALSDDAELYNEIQDIKDLIFEQRKQIEELDNSERSLRVDKNLEELLSCIGNIEKVATGADLEKNASDIKDSVMTAILSVTDQISFAQETEEIKDFVEERTEEINKNLLDVKKQLSNIACSSEAWDYSYTMQDIESDIAKLRLVLNDISSSSSRDEIGAISNNIHKIASSVDNMQSSLTQEQILGLKNDFEKLNDDIVSISSRTNKLLLTSDESYRALTGGLDEFSRVINDLEYRINSFDNSAINGRLEKKLESINSMVTSSANSDKVMKQVMMYLGEWIDGASEKLEGINSNTSSINSIQSEIGVLKSLMPEKHMLIKSIENKFEEQQNRIDRLEQKIEKVLTAIDEKDNSDLEKKIDRIEKQLNKLGSGIEKLASYVDEE